MLTISGTPIMGEREEEIKKDLESYVDSDMALLGKGPGARRTDLHYFINVVGVLDLVEYTHNLEIKSGTHFANKIIERMENISPISDMVDTGELSQKLEILSENILRKTYLSFEDINNAVMYATTLFCNVKECIDAAHILKPALYERNMGLVMSCAPREEPRSFIVWTIDDHQHSDLVISLKIDTDSFIVFSVTVPVLGHPSFAKLSESERAIEIEIQFRKVHFRLSSDAVMDDSLKIIEAAEMLSTRYRHDVVMAVMNSFGKQGIIINTDKLPPVSIN